MNIHKELIVKAARFISNHKLKGVEFVRFNSHIEKIEFIDRNDELVAWVDYNNTTAKHNYFIKEKVL